MERILNDDERIRRAEEIYFRRNNGIKVKQTQSSKVGFRNKLLFNLLVMFNLAVIVFCVQNKNYIFTTEFLEKINSYNVSIGDKIKELLASEKIDEKTEETNIVSNNEILPVAEDKTDIENAPEEKISSISEMELDANNLKASYSFAKPLSNYQISSGFGARESEYQNVTGYHTGIDLAVEKGTVITASLEGIVELASSEGDYGKHIKIRCNNVTTLYAHCSKLLVKEGQIVAQGQPIALSGSTGNSTGPHLHFEIRVDDRFVDPVKVLDF